MSISGSSMASPPGRGSTTGNGNFCQKKEKGRGERETVEEEEIVTKRREERKSIKFTIAVDVWMDV